MLLPAIALNKGLAWDKTGDAERSLTKYFKIQTKFGVAFALSFPLIGSPTTVYKVLTHTLVIKGQSEAKYPDGRLF